MAGGGVTGAAKPAPISNVVSSASAVRQYIVKTGDRLIISFVVNKSSGRLFLEVAISDWMRSFYGFL